MSDTTQDKNAPPIMQYVGASFCLLFSIYYIYVGTLETSALNWNPTSSFRYSDTVYFYNQTFQMLFLSIVAITLYSGLIMKKILLLIGATCLGLMVTFAGLPSNAAKNMTRIAGLERGGAKEGGWLPQSYECNVYSKGKEPDDKYPRIWTDSGVAQWAKDELAKTSSMD